jgi:Cu-Zn family superoxide dismutase
MTRFALPLIAIAGLAFSVDAFATQHEEHAVHAGRAATSLRNTQGQVVGEASAAREGGVIKVRLTVRGFAAGTYGVHLHQTGRCDAPDFASAGGHWNPAGHQHGRLNPQGAHLGDLPNLEVRANGTGRIDFEVPVPAGVAAGAHPLLDEDGTAIVIHAAPDDYRTDPSGNSGARIACGVLSPLR